MHNSFLFIRPLTKTLASEISGWRIGTCFSQNKDELLIGLYQGKNQLYIKADLNAQFSCLSFQEEYSRARKNSVDLFPEIIGQEIMDVNLYRYERAFSFTLTNDLILLFKLFGNFSNILLYKKSSCLRSFKSKLKDDFYIQLNELGKDIQIAESDFIQQACDVSNISPVFDKYVARHLKRLGFDTLNAPDKWKLFNDVLSYLEEPGFHIYQDQQQVKLSLFEEDQIIESFSNPMDAINRFYLIRQKNDLLNREKKKIISALNQQIRKTNNYINKTAQKLKELESSQDFKEVADIIMANLHLIKPGIPEVEVFDFYNQKEIRIRLNERLSPQKNAEQYYRKSKNRNIELTALNENLSKKRRLSETTAQHIENIIREDDVKLLRKYLQEHMPGSGKTIKIDVPVYKEFECMSFKILVGRNAKNNDQLSFIEGKKDDLWLHAKDVTGSHVLIKQKSGHPFPKPVIQKAAELAAFYSKNRNNSVCPVIYTPRKFVRKAKGLPAGAVIVDREAVILVNPSEKI